MDRQREEQEIHPEKISEVGGALYPLSVLWDIEYAKIEARENRREVFAFGYSDSRNRKDSQSAGL